MSVASGAHSAIASDWPSIGMLLCGVLAATSVDKLPPAIPALREALGASLHHLLGVQPHRCGSQYGCWPTTPSVGARSVSGCSRWCQRAARHRRRRGALMFASRIVEGMGSVGVAVPALLREVAATERLSLVLGLWSSYMALSMTTMLLVAPLWMASSGWLGAAVFYLCVGRCRCWPRRPRCLRRPPLQWMVMMVGLPNFPQDGLDFSPVRGFGMRNLWAPEPKRVARLLELWQHMLAAYIETHRAGAAIDA